MIVPVDQAMDAATNNGNVALSCGFLRGIPRVQQLSYVSVAVSFMHIVLMGGNEPSVISGLAALRSRKVEEGETMGEAIEAIESMMWLGEWLERLGDGGEADYRGGIYTRNWSSAQIAIGSSC